MYINGKSDRKIAMDLNKKGIPTKKNKKWTEARIRYILTNPLYMGYVRWGVRKNQDSYFEVRGDFDPIIDEDTFNEAQSIRISKRRFHGRQLSSDSIFTGVLRCTRCGSAFKGQTKTLNRKYRQKSYKCVGRHQGLCDMEVMSERMVESAFLRYVKKINLLEATQQALKETKTKSKNPTKVIEDELKAIKSRRKKWQYAWANNHITEDEFTELMKEEKDKEAELTNRLKELAPKSSEKLIDEETIELLAELVMNWNSLDVMEKKQLVQMTVDKVVVDKIDAPKLHDRVKVEEITFI